MMFFFLKLSKFRLNKVNLKSRSENFSLTFFFFGLEVNFLIIFVKKDGKYLKKMPSFFIFFFKQ